MSALVADWATILWGPNVPIETTCPSCNATFRDVPDELAQTEVRCRQCGRTFTVEPVQLEPPPQEPPVVPGELVAADESPRITFADVQVSDYVASPPSPAAEPASAPRSPEPAPELAPSSPDPPEHAQVVKEQPPDPHASPAPDETEPKLEPPPSTEVEPPPPDHAAEQDGNDTDGATGDAALAPLPIIIRLEEMARKCRTLGQRHPEIGDMTPVLHAAIDALRAGHGPRGDGPHYADTAATLLALPRLFAKRGFTTLAREVEFVQKTLLELHVDRDDALTRASAASTGPAEPDAGPKLSSAAVRSDDEPDRDNGRSTRVVYAAVIAAVVLVAVVSAVLVRTAGRDPDTATHVVPSVAPTPTAEPSPTPTRPPPSPTTGGGSNLAELLSRARLALQEDDVDRAIVHLSILALIERRSSEVLDTAQSAIEVLKRRAEVAARDQDGLPRARAELDRARELARRFELPSHDIDRLERRLSSLQRVHRRSPNDQDLLRTLVGQEVRLNLTNGDNISGVLHEVSTDTLTLKTRKTVGGGHFTYTTAIPVTEIEEVVYTTGPS